MNNKLPNKIKNLIKAKNFGFDVPNFIIINSNNFKKNQKSILDKINLNFSNEKKLILRSAAFDEDNLLSNAGRYDSFLVKKNNKINEKINTIFSKYKKQNGYIIVQKYIEDSFLNGVVFTQGLNGFENYLTINFFKGKSTNRITSGSVNGNYFVFFSQLKPSIVKDSYIKKILKTSLQIQKKFNSKNLDIEFSINKKKQIKIFQIRKLNSQKKFKNISYKTLYDLKKKLKKMLNDKNLLNINKTIYSNMTDWNPAEMLGLNPKPLASSLYKELITNKIWSKSRKELGYSDCMDLPLIHEFMGKPYVDVGLSLYSFIPNDLDENLKYKLLNYYLKSFKKKPDFYYDKIESKLVFSSIDFSSNEKIKILKKFNFSDKEIFQIKKSLLNLTNKLIKCLNENLNISNQIIKKTKIIINEKLHPINKIYKIINLCKIYGTLPFANIARLAFISMQFLDSMKYKKIISSKEHYQFLNSLETITSKMKKDSIKLNKKKFLDIYGHIRPNTYEINSKNYKDNYSNYFANSNNKNFIKKKFEFDLKIKKNISKYLKRYKFNHKTDEFLSFLKLSIISREKSKFNFTYCINEIFKQIILIGKKAKINQNDLSYLNINVILNLYNNFIYRRVKDILITEIKKNKKDYFFNQHIKFPNIIKNENDVFLFTENNSKATYVGSKNVFGKTVLLDEKNLNLNLNNKIVLIKNADPGYDFIFSKKIRGLVTAYGGPNSHMFIRCNEIGIPAAIGIGDKNFDKLTKANNVFLNCEEKDLKII